MSESQYKLSFINSSKEWLCDSYSVDIRYIAKREGNEIYLLEAVINYYQLPLKDDSDLRLDTSHFIAGRRRLNNLSRNKLLSILEEAIDGKIRIGRRILTLKRQGTLNYFSQLGNRDSWFNQLNIRVSGDKVPSHSVSDIVEIDNVLRRGTPPFDSTYDLANWLAISDPFLRYDESSVKINIGPPLDIIFNDCGLREGHLTIAVHAHPKLDVHSVGLAVLGYPGKGIMSRLQIASSIKWKRSNARTKVGNVELRLDEVDSAEVILMVGNSTIRRQWFSDPARSRNNRFLAIHTFDNDLRMIKKAIVDATDSRSFEIAIGAILFLLGFSPMVQLEKDSPDLVVVTPAGVLMLVECTTRISDFHSKLGKLVDRRGQLLKSLTSSGHADRVDALLVCAQNRDQIVAKDEEDLQQIKLITRDDIDRLLELVRYPGSQDDLLRKILQ